MQKENYANANCSVLARFLFLHNGRGWNSDHDFLKRGKTDRPELYFGISA